MGNNLMKYKVKAIGRTSKALGVRYLFEEEVEVEEEKDIWLALYEGRTKSGKAWECVSKINIQLLDLKDNYIS
jgi:hypothetical protein